MSKSTMPEMWRGLMDAPDLLGRHCMVCGRWGAHDKHHAVPRSAGELYQEGVKRKKPLITLCGFGNTSGCHGLAHSGRLHFDYRDGDWWYLIVGEPMDRLTALESDGWVRIDRDRESEDDWFTTRDMGDWGCE